MYFRSTENMSVIQSIEYWPHSPNSWSRHNQVKHYKTIWRQAKKESFWGWTVKGDISQRQTFLLLFLNNAIAPLCAWPLMMFNGKWYSFKALNNTSVCDFTDVLWRTITSKKCSLMLLFKSTIIIQQNVPGFMNSPHLSRFWRMLLLSLSI